MRRAPLLLASAGLASAAAVTILAVTMAGGGPIKPDSPRARDCPERTVRTNATEGRLVAGPDGKPRVTTVSGEITRQVARCP